jgi:hypothetical protein
MSVANPFIEKARRQQEPQSKPDSNVFPGFRSSDPATSRDGAKDAYSRTGTHRYKAFQAIACANGMTWDEVATQTGIQGIWKRLSELKNEGWIEAAGTRVCKTTGSPGTVYVLSSMGREWLDRK